MRGITFNSRRDEAIRAKRQREARAQWVRDVCRDFAIPDHMRDFWLATGTPPLRIARYIREILASRRDLTATPQSGLNPSQAKLALKNPRAET